MKKLIAVAFVALLALPSAFAATQGQRGGFEIFQGGPQRLNQQTYFRLVAANKQIVLQSEAYTSVAAAKTGIMSILGSGVATAKVGFSKNRGYYFSIRGLNFKITATSEVYKSKSNVTRALKAIQTLINRVKAQTLKQLAAK